MCVEKSKNNSQKNAFSTVRVKQSTFLRIYIQNMYLVSTSFLRIASKCVF